MLWGVGKFSFLGLKWQSRRSGRCLSDLLWLVSYCSHLNQIVSIYERSICEHNEKQKENNKYTRDYVFLDLFIT